MVEVAGQMRKPRFRESSTVCQMTPSKKGHEAGPGVRGVRMAEVRWHIKYQMYSPSRKWWPSFNYLQGRCPSGFSTPAARPRPANKLQARGDLTAATAY